MVKNRFKFITVKTMDTDVVVLLTSFMPDFISYHASIQIDFNFGKHRKCFNINRVAKGLGFNKCFVLRFFYAFTGCDYNSFFFGYSKRKLFAVWLEKLPELTFTFSELSCMPDSLSSESMNACEEFLMAAYDNAQMFGNCGLNNLRFHLFNSSSINDLRRLPPTLNALKLHVLRAAYIAGWVWGSCLQKGSVVPSVWYQLGPQLQF